jgi:hypothetical protein
MFNLLHLGRVKRVMHEDDPLEAKRAWLKDQIIPSAIEFSVSIFFTIT